MVYQKLRQFELYDDFRLEKEIFRYFERIQV